jgi:hypothetical protein
MSDDNCDALSKLVFVASGAWVMGKPTTVKFVGTKTEIDVVAEVLQASRAFVEELNNESATTETLAEKLDAKRAASTKFDETMNLKWML